MKYAVLALWIVLASVAAPLALKLTGALNNETLGALPASAEAAVAQERIENAFPDSNKVVAVAVYARDTGLTDADRAKVEADRTAFAAYADGTIEPAAPSEDGKALLLAFPLAGDETAQATAVDDIKARLGTGPDGLRAALTGEAGAMDDIFDAFEGMDGALLLATALTVAVLLLLTYRSPILWLVPLFAVGIANQLAGAVVYLLAEYGGLTVDFQSQSILTVLVFGVGVDYALLLIARYREELRRHADRHEAMGVAVRRSFPAILASAGTVAAGMLCLLAVDLPATRGLGPVGAVGVAATFVAMTTLLPALLVLFGRWLFWPFVPRYTPGVEHSDVAEDHRGWARISRAIDRRPRLVWVSALAVLAGLSFGIVNLGIGLPNDGSFTREVGSVTGQKLITAHYAGGTVAPAEIVASADRADQVSAAARGVAGVSSVREPQRSTGTGEVLIEAVLADEPDSDAAKATVDRLRAAVQAVPGARAVVGGATATELDNDRVVSRDNKVAMPLILAVIFAILVLLLRSLVAPLILIASVVVSYAAALGAAGLILKAMGYENLWVALPLQTFLFLVALGVDYTIFLMTRAREEVAKLGHRRGVLHALTVTGGVITSAGVVLAATFAALSVLPLVPSVQTGVIVAAGVLLDTFLVRSLLVPALAVHIGPRTWWPSRPVVPMVTGTRQGVNVAAHSA